MELDTFTNNYVPRHYLIMEFLVGVNLDDLIGGIIITSSGVRIQRAHELHYKLINNRREAVIEIMTSILEGVKVLHSYGYIHRDIDPSNIMITVNGEIKLIDYGISRSLTSNNVRYGTAHGHMLGKVDYAAPELISGEVNKHGITTDIYSLGILLYQLIVGSLPFIGDQASVMRAQLSEPVPVENISDVVIRRVVAKATQKEQNDRYQTIDEFFNDLLSPEEFIVNPVQKKINNVVPIWVWCVSIVLGIIFGIGTAILITIL